MGEIYGIEYELYNSESTLYNNVFSESNNGDSPLRDRPAACAVCYATGRKLALTLSLTKTAFQLKVIDLLLVCKN